MKKKLLPVFVITAVTYSLLLVADYFNFPSYLGIDVPAMNWDFLSLVIGNGLVVFFYVVTYLLIDHREIQKSDNQLWNVRQILIDIYRQCKEIIEDLDDPQARSSIVEKCDFDLPRFNEPMFLQIQNLPFELEQYIMDASNNGVLSEDEFRMYLLIRREYKKYVANRITFFDIEDTEKEKPLKQAIMQKMCDMRSFLLTTLESQIFRLATNNWDER